MRIIESISRKGIKSSDHDHHRLTHPHPGDAFEYESGKFGVIDLVQSDGSVVVCLEVYPDGAFLLDSGQVCISGGPFEHYEPEAFEACIAMRDVKFWNWGDNMPGGGKGCVFTLSRPVFKAICTK